MILEERAVPLQIGRRPTLPFLLLAGEIIARGDCFESLNAKLNFEEQLG